MNRLELWLLYTLQAKEIRQRITRRKLEGKRLESQLNMMRWYEYKAKVQWHPKTRKQFFLNRQRKIDEFDEYLQQIKKND